MLLNNTVNRISPWKNISIHKTKYPLSEIPARSREELLAPSPSPEPQGNGVRDRNG